MTTQVYYRKWRPNSFSGLVGQEHVATTLRQATKLDRVSHSYLFCGPRGSGKTTTARIMAKAVNCLDLQDGDPCNACSVCVAVNDGRFMDIIELDAASNRGINEIRDIRDKVNFSPVQGRRKVYILDEAHMLTTEASNAFLKTLEEPPAHVIFVLCTTEAHRILATIASRCQRFDFRRIPSEQVFGRLAEIAEAEGVSVDSDALRMVARFSGGSLRDAENLLEQLVVSYADGVGVKQVEDLLGLGHGERWLELTKCLLMGNTAGALGVINEAAWDGADLRQLHRQTTELLRAAMLLHWGSEDIVDLPDQTLSQMKELVGQLPPWRIVRALKVWGEVNMRYDAPSPLPLELASVQICDDSVSQPGNGVPQPVNGVPEEVRAPAGAAAPRPAAAPPANNAPPASAPYAPQAPSRPAARSTPPQDSAPPRVAPSLEPPAPRVPAPGDGSLAANWAAVVKTLGRHKGKKYNLGALLRDCKFADVSIEDNTLVLPFTHRANLERMEEEIGDPKCRRLVGDAFNTAFGGDYEFRLTLLDDNRDNGGSSGAAQNSPLVRVALGMGARIIEEDPR